MKQQQQQGPLNGHGLEQLGVSCSCIKLEAGPTFKPAVAGVYLTPNNDTYIRTGCL
jgi:hypothetical protein